MYIKVEISKAQLKGLIIQHLQDKLGDLTINPQHVEIQTKSSQNYKSEWEKADFKAVYETNEA